MLNILRKRLEPLLCRSARLVASTGISPNQLSILSFFASIVAAVIYALSSHPTFTNSYFITLMASTILLLGGIFDILDGAVARLTNKSTKRGAFMDSVLDKVGEIAVFISIYLGNLSSAFWCLIAVSLALLVSYTRARAESLDIPLVGIGIGERAERLLILALIGMIPLSNAVQVAVIIVSIVAGITIIQRVNTVTRRL